MSAAMASRSSIKRPFEACCERRHETILAIRDGDLSMDELIRDQIHSSFGFRFAIAETYATAMSVENRVKHGALGRPPRLRGPLARQAAPSRFIGSSAVDHRTTGESAAQGNQQSRPDCRCSDESVCR